MFLKNIYLRGLRNLAEQEVEFSDRVTFIVGNNGHGKTSLLEAIYLLAHSKSFRTAKRSEIISWSKSNTSTSTFEAGSFKASEPTAEIKAEIETQNGLQHLSLVLDKKRRIVKLNENPLENVLDFYGNVRVVIFTPEELQLTKGPAQQRRNFVDRTLAMLDKAYLKHTVLYQRAIKNRNVLLVKHEQRNKLSEYLSFWDSLLFEHGLEISRKRKDFIDFIKPLFIAQYCSIAGEKADEQVSIAYQSDFLDSENEFVSRDICLGRYRSNLERDLRLKSTSLGVHRDELVLEINTGDGMRHARTWASQGQSRTIALSLKLAALEYIKNYNGEEPILLLDDVESELDETRKAALYRLLKDSRSQVIITGTNELPGLEGMKPSIKRMQKGSLSPA